MRWDSRQAERGKGDLLVRGEVVRFAEKFGGGVQGHVHEISRFFAADRTKCEVNAMPIGAPSRSLARFPADTAANDAFRWAVAVLRLTPGNLQAQPQCCR